MSVTFWRILQVLDQCVPEVLARLLATPLDGTAHVVFTMQHLLACLKRITLGMERACRQESDLLLTALQYLAGSLKSIANAATFPQHLQQAGMQELLICTADELLAGKAAPAPASLSDPGAASAPAQQRETAQLASKYEHLDVELEEI